MKFLSFFVTSILFSMTMVPIGAQAKNEGNPSKPPQVTGNHSIVINGTATMVGQWSCGGDVKVSTTPDPSEPPAPGLPTGVQVSAVTPVPAINCGDSKMNEHMQKALKEKEFPEIRFKTDKYNLIDNGKAVKTAGELTIAGVTKPVEIEAKLMPVPQGGTRVTGQINVDMADFGVKPPSLFFGSMKVAKMVTIRFDTVVPPPNQVPQSLGQ